MLDKIINYFSPAWGLERQRNRELLEKRAYKAAEHNRFLEWRRDRGDGDAVVRRAGEQLVLQARDLDQNNDIAGTVLNILVNKTIGTGIAIEPAIKLKNGAPAKGLNSKIRKLWKNWVEAPEVTGELSWSAVQRLACRTLYRDGEFFYQHLITDSINHKTIIPYSIELIECDKVPWDYDEIGNNIFAGVRKDHWGRPTGYFIYEEHPGALYYAPNKTLNLNEYSAEAIGHLKIVERFNQTRGVTIFAPLVFTLDKVLDIENAELVASEMAANMAAFIRKGSLERYGEYSESGDYRELELKPGMIFDGLAPGEEIGTIGHSRPNPAVVDFHSAMIRKIAGRVSVQNSTLSGLYTGSYSAERQAAIDNQPAIKINQDYFISKFNKPIYRRFIEVARDQWLIKIDAEVDLLTLLDAEFRAPVPAWIDPQSEMSYRVEAVQNKFMSRKQVIRDMGNDPDEVDMQIQEDNVKLNDEN